MRCRLLFLASTICLLAACAAIPTQAPGPGPGAGQGPGADAVPGADPNRNPPAITFPERDSLPEFPVSPVPGPGSGSGAELPREPVLTAAATGALLSQSQAQRNAGDLGGAATTMERALSIAPDEPSLWVELAEIRLDQGDAAQAEALARKALTLTGENSSLAARARRLLRR